MCTSVGVSANQTFRALILAQLGTTDLIKNNTTSKSAHAVPGAIDRDPDRVKMTAVQLTAR
jgi:hypothetical protein